MARRLDSAPRRVRRSTAFFTASMTMAIVTIGAWPVLAQVIEIAPDGDASVYAGPVVSSSNSRQPIARPARTGGPATTARDKTGSLAAAIGEASARRQLSERLIEAVAWQESRLNQNAVSPKGARGVMQLMPSTARDLGVDANDLRGNLDGGAAYLTRLLGDFDGDIVLTLAAYNAGPAAVRRWGRVPPYPETQAYVAAVLDRLAKAASPTRSLSESR